MIENFFYCEEVLLDPFCVSDSQNSAAEVFKI